MRFTGSITAALFAVGLLASGPAFAGTCRTEKLTCPTGMPDGGYCECTARGNTESGTVISKSMPRQSTKATAGGCGAHPDAAGCR